MGAERHEAAPVAGAQWDELHRRWERWDEASQGWVVVGDDAGDGVEPADENPYPSLLARELHHADELDEVAEPDVDDIARAAAPPEHVPGAQWNEIARRWERWDDVAGRWVAVDAS